MALKPRARYALVGKVCAAIAAGIFQVADCAFLAAAYFARRQFPASFINRLPASSHRTA
jgi:hypothetical protein